MADLVVTVPMKLWDMWIDEGDSVGEPETGEEWGFYLGPTKPPITAGERLYIVAHGLLRGYAPVTGVEKDGNRGGYESALRTHHSRLLHQRDRPRGIPPRLVSATL